MRLASLHLQQLVHTVEGSATNVLLHERWWVRREREVCVFDTSSCVSFDF